MAKVRLFVPEPLQSDEEITLSGKQAHYLTHVMRLDVGSVLRLFNGRDGEWQGRLVAAGRGGCLVRIQDRLRQQQPEPGPWLVFGALKKDAQDTLVAQATALGVERLLPVITSFTSVSRVNVERLRVQGIEAAEQCGRLSVPDIGAIRPLAPVLAEWPAERALLFANERGTGTPIVDALQRLGHCAAGLLIGPEGGFTDDEVRLILAHPCAAGVDLGPRILRAETAAVAALACWQALCGDWRS